MKSITKISLILCLAVIAFHSSAFAQTKKTAQAGMAFLNIGVGARAAGLGGSFVSQDNDLSAIFWNPAGIASVERGAYCFERNVWFADITQNAMALAYNLGKYGVLGASFIGMDYGTFYGTEISAADDDFFNYVETGEFTIDEYAVGISYARIISNKFYVGATAKYVAQDLFENMIQKGLDPEKKVDNKVDVVAFDFGTLYKTGFKSLAFAMSARNFSKDIQFPEQSEKFTLPLIFSMGVKMDVLNFYPSINEKHTLTISIDGQHPRDYSEKLCAGAEYSYMDMIFVRLGYKWNFGTENVAAGFGFKHNLSSKIGFVINYAYSNMKYFDGVHRFSISGTF